MLHVLVGENAARDQWESCVRCGRAISWVVPRAAGPGDDVLFVFNRDQLVGTGTIAGVPAPTTFRGRPAFRTKVRDLRQFVSPLPVADVAVRIPEWRWPASHTKGRTTPSDSIARKLDQAVAAHSARVGLAGPDGEGPAGSGAPHVRAPSPSRVRGVPQADRGAATRWNAVIPAAERGSAAQALSRSIRAAHALHPASWTVTLSRGFVRLSVGVPLALTLAPGGCQLIVMRGAPAIPALRHLGLRRQGGFVKAPGTVCVSFPLAALGEVHRRLWSSHAAALQIAVRKQGTTPHTGYSHDLVAHLRAEGFDIPDSQCKGALAERQEKREAHAPGVEFDPASLSDDREYERKDILRRQGQPVFRLALLRAYGGRCALTGCGVVAVLQAAHIFAYRGAATNRVENGLLLRSDIHDLFDLGKLGFDEGWRVRLHDDLRGSEYQGLEGRRLRMPRERANRPSRKALRARREEA